LRLICCQEEWGALLEAVSSFIEQELMSEPKLLGGFNHLEKY